MTGILPYIMLTATHLFAYSKLVTLFKGDTVFVCSGSHVVIQLVEKYPNYYIVNLDKVM